MYLYIICLNNHQKSSKEVDNFPENLVKRSSNKLSSSYNPSCFINRASNKEIIYRILYWTRSSLLNIATLGISRTYIKVDKAFSYR